MLIFSYDVICFPNCWWIQGSASLHHSGIIYRATFFSHPGNWEGNSTIVGGLCLLSVSQIALQAASTFWVMLDKAFMCKVPSCKSLWLSIWHKRQPLQSQFLDLSLGNLCKAPPKCFLSLCGSADWQGPLLASLWASLQPTHLPMFSDSGSCLEALFQVL